MTESENRHCAALHSGFCVCALPAVMYEDGERNDGVCVLCVGVHYPNRPNGARYLAQGNALG